MRIQSLNHHDIYILFMVDVRCRDSKILSRIKIPPSASRDECAQSQFSGLSAIGQLSLILSRICKTLDLVHSLMETDMNINFCRCISWQRVQIIKSFTTSWSMDGKVLGFFLSHIWPITGQKTLKITNLYPLIKDPESDVLYYLVLRAVDQYMSQFNNNPGENNQN